MNRLSVSSFCWMKDEARFSFAALAKIDRREE
jgi:hypothetical protein